MKSVIICPERPAVNALARPVPLMNVSVFGKELIHYWIEHLVTKGVTHLYLLASDRPEQVRAATGDGARWGITIDVLPVSREITVREARKKMRREDDPGWLNEPDDVVVADHFPTLPAQKLFASYHDFFATLKEYFPQAAAKDRIGLREIRPGIWAGLKACISPTATLTAPCWISDYALIGPHAVVGPMAIVESCAVVGARAVVRESLVGPETFVGKFLSLEGSIANRDTLIDYRNNSCADVTDAFLLCGLQDEGKDRKWVNWSERLAAIAAIIVSAPVAALHLLSGAIQGIPLVRQRDCVSVNRRGQRRIIKYYQISAARGLWRRWPELWNIAKGEFSWVGNRPLTPSQADRLTTDFERLWLVAPIGLFSQADVSCCGDEFSDDSRVHSAFYAAQGNRDLDFAILRSILGRFFASRKSPTGSTQLPPRHRKETPVAQAITR